MIATQSPTFLVEVFAPPTLKLGGRGAEVGIQWPRVHRALPLWVARFCRSPVCPALPVAYFAVFSFLPVAWSLFFGTGVLCSPPAFPGVDTAAGPRMSSSEKELVLRVLHARNQTSAEFAEAAGRHKSCITRLPNGRQIATCAPDAARSPPVCQIATCAQIAT